MILTVFIIVSLLISLFCFQFLKINYKPNKTQYKQILIIFIMGAITKFLSYGCERYIKDFFNTGQENDYIEIILAYSLMSAINVSMVVAVFLLFKTIFSKAIVTPIDCLIYIVSCALGCAAVENVYLLSTTDIIIVYYLILYNFVAYVLAFAPIAYWFIMNTYVKDETKREMPIKYFIISLIAITSFRIISIVLIELEALMLNFLFCSFSFFICISFLITSVKNAHNISPNFTYKKDYKQSHIKKTTSLIFIVIVIIQITMTTISFDISNALFFAVPGSMYILTMKYLSIKTLSRIKFIRNDWSPLRLEFPYRLPPMGLGIFDDDIEEERLKAVPKLETNNDIHISSYYQEYFTLHLYPYTDEKYLAFIEEKHFFSDKSCFFLTRLYETDENSAFRYIILMPKKGNANYAFDKYLLIAIMNINHVEEIEDLKIDNEAFSFENWGIIIDLDSEFSVYPE